MTNRREFLQTGVSMSALPLTSGLLSPDAPARVQRNDMPRYKAIFDDRYAEARSFAGAIGQLGVPVHALTNGDVTDLWHRERNPLRGEPPSVIAGMTQFGPMLVFEQLGREHRMRVALRVEHRVRGDGTIAHVVTGSSETVVLAEQSRLQGMDWPVLIGALLTHCLTHCRTDGSAAVEHTIVTPGSKPVLQQTRPSHDSPVPESVIHYYVPHSIREGHGVAWDAPLFSWVIAPVELASAAQPASSRL